MTRTPVLIVFLTVAGLELAVSLGTAASLTAVFALLTTYLYGRR